MEIKVVLKEWDNRFLILCDSKNDTNIKKCFRLVTALIEPFEKIYLELEEKSSSTLLKLSESYYKKENLIISMCTVFVHSIKTLIKDTENIIIKETEELDKNRLNRTIAFISLKNKLIEKAAIICESDTW